MKKLALFYLGLFFMVSCSYDTDKKSNNQSQSKKATDENLEKLKLDFAKSLSKCLIESPKTREIIKNKSLEMFNNDYEILFYTIKDLSVENGKTIEDLLKNNFENTLGYSELLNLIPTLSILVPELPEESFSASKWNISEIPAVGVNVDGTNDVPVVFNDGKIETIEGKYTPDFPVIVIKDNERVISNLNPNYGNINTREFYTSNSIKFRFLDDAFDSTKNIAERLVSTSQMDQKLIDAYQVYNYEHPELSGWHRDLVYYNIAPSTPNGQFLYNYQEHLRSFRMSGNPVNSYNKISDQTGDPTYISTLTNLSSSHWTSGYYEFKVKVLVNSKNGIGAEIVKYISATPSEIFNLNYEKKKYLFVNVWKLKDISFNVKSLSLPIFNWDLDEYASTIKIEIEEVDLTTTTVLTDTRTVKFATNFNIDTTLGQKVKVGLKFGSSLETTTTSTVQKTFTEGNDQLGDVIVNFADNVIIGQVSLPFGGLKYVTREYDSGWYSISVEPKRVQ